MPVLQCRLEYVWATSRLPCAGKDAGQFARVLRIKKDMDGSFPTHTHLS
jgi:hypothetical protein